jgi:hypothetical protein
MQCMQTTFVLEIYSIRCSIIVQAYNQHTARIGLEEEGRTQYRLS